MRAACTGFQTVRHLHLAALGWITVTPLCNPVIPPVQIPNDSVRPRNAPVKSHNAPTKSRAPPVHTSYAQASAIAMRAPSGAPFASPLPRKCRRRRRRKAHRAANENTAPRSAAPVTPDECWVNQNAGFQRATQHQPEASDLTQMKSAAMYKDPSIHSHPFTQPPISATNRNSAFTFGLERCEIPGLYKPAFPGLRQSVVSQIPLSAQLLLLSLAQTLSLLVGLSVSLLIVGVRV